MPAVDRADVRLFGRAGEWTVELDQHTGFTHRLGVVSQGEWVHGWAAFREVTVNGHQAFEPVSAGHKTRKAAVDSLITAVEAVT